MPVTLRVTECGSPCPPRPHPQAHSSGRQPRVSHFPTNDTAQVAAFVAISLHRGD